MRKSASLHKKYQFPPEIIEHAVWLYYRFGLSQRDIEDLLAERGIIVSYGSIRLWRSKFGPAYARRLKRRHRVLRPVTIHDTSQYANNRAELSHQPTRVRERGMRGLKSVQQAQRFLGVHAAVYNFFNWVPASRLMTWNQASEKKLKEATQSERKKNKQLQKELDRKEKALAEAAALLVL